MLTAAKEERFSAPMVWTDECVLALAADPAYETHFTTTAQLSENSRLGFARKNLAPHPGSGFVNSTSALGIEPVLVTEGVRSSSSGRENDGTGLYFYRARYYDPTLQRFISEDPIGFGGGQANLYAYVGNSPLNMIDPTGREGVSCVTAYGPGICDTVTLPPPPPPCMAGRKCGDPPTPPPPDDPPTVGPGTPGFPGNPLGCSGYLDGTGAGQILFGICMKAPDNQWGRCVRGRLINQYVPNGNPAQLAVYLFVDHAYDFAACGVQ
jgi:RHS repeat-associated protein